MSTRSFIAIKVPGGYMGIYSHWDGYPQKPGVGWQLKRSYTTTDKVKKLIALGDISSLKSNIGRKHDFDKPSQSTTAYHRDRGEAWSQVKPKLAQNLQVLMQIADRMGCEWVYVWENGRWNTYEVPTHSGGVFGVTLV